MCIFNLTWQTECFPELQDLQKNSDLNLSRAPADNAYQAIILSCLL